MPQNRIVAPSEEYLAQSDTSLSDVEVVIAAEFVLTQSELYKQINTSRLIRIAKSVGSFILEGGAGLVGQGVPHDLPTINE